MTEITQEDVDVFMESLRRKGTPWADGCAALIGTLWNGYTPRPEAVPLAHVAQQIDEYAGNLETMAEYVKDAESWRGAFKGLRKFVAMKLKNSAPSPRGCIRPHCLDEGGLCNVECPGGEPPEPQHDESLSTKEK